MELASKAYVKNLIAHRTERKSFVYQTISQAVGTTGVSHNVLDMDQGDNNGFRDGNVIRAKKIRLRVHWTMNNQSVSDGHNTCRFILLQDKSPGAGLGAANLLHNTPYWISDFNWVKRKGYHVLLDNTTQLTNNSDHTKFWSFERNYDFPVTFYGTAGTDGAKNQLFVYAFSDSSAIDHPQLSFDITTYYDDE